MSAKPIYRVTYPNEPEKDRPFNWGPRYYFSDCFKEGTQLEWLKNNLETADGSPAKSEISAAWTFGHKWDPERTDIPKIIKYKINGNSLLLFFDEKITIIGKPVIQSNDGSILKYNSGGGSDTIAFTADTPIDKSRLVGLRITNSSKIIASSASVQERDADLNLK